MPVERCSPPPNLALCVGVGVGIGAAIGAAIGVVLDTVPRAQQLVPHTCVNSGYTTTGLPGPVCPECGEPHESDDDGDGSPDADRADPPHA